MLTEIHHENERGNIITLKEELVVKWHGRIGQ
jgi:hypothetical protein